MIESNIIAHATTEGVRESCGLVSGGIYFPCTNIHPDPENYFEISSEEWLRAESHAEVEAVVHSHPAGLPFLSAGDRDMQVKTGLPWWLVCDDRLLKFNPVPRLLGREFNHGVQDCYSIIRDAYHLCGISLDDFERHDNWWYTGDNLYLDNIPGQGFYQVDEVRDGDVILICLGTSKPCHAALYIGNQEILHHRPDRLSKRDVYGGYWFKFTHSIWRHKQWSDYSLLAIYADMDAGLN
ncbi:C40 family peptidase [Morganella morganii subsp. morganii]|uniref:C40 family peptidase n=1 Tax=Morganella morganii TaxID=582 RepID=UPI001BD9805C|nr:C40 family peptidase [Morganella morganii]MBT0372700.1 C40 family peptidase [Morganella morganii subsp. morganii]